jgi:hypothetical protein
VRNPAPLGTLLAVVLFAAVLYGVNVLGTPAPAGPAAAAAPSAAPAPTAAPEPAAPPDPGRAFTGRSAGGEVTVAVAVKAGRATAFVCDGRKVAAWLAGTVEDGRLDLRGGGGVLTGTVDGDAAGGAALGTVVVGGRNLPFSAAGVAAPAGLYQGSGTVDGEAALAGWIVQQDGRVSGVVDVGGTGRPAPPLDPRDPGATVLDGEPVTVSPVAGDTAVPTRQEDR